MTNRKLAPLATVLLTILLAGCASNPKPKPLPTGAYNTTDAHFYAALVTARGAIDGACLPGTSVAANATNGLKPCAVKPELAKFKPQINQAIDSWNVAAAAEMTYRNALKNGGTPDPAEVNAAVIQVTANTAALITSISGGN